MGEVRIGEVRVVLDETPPVDRFNAVIVVLFFWGKFVLVKNSLRAWEFPGGRREGSEAYQETVAREIMEEAGAKTEEVWLLGYAIDQENQFTLIAWAEAFSFGPLPESSEIVEVGFFEELPDDLSFGDGREKLILDIAREIRAGHYSKSTVLKR